MELSSRLSLFEENWHCTLQVFISLSCFAKGWSLFVRVIAFYYSLSGSIRSARCRLGHNSSFTLCTKTSFKLQSLSISCLFLTNFIPIKYVSFSVTYTAKIWFLCFFVRKLGSKWIWEVPKELYWHVYEGKRFLFFKVFLWFTQFCNDSTDKYILL